MTLIPRDASELPVLPQNQSVQSAANHTREVTADMIDHRQLFEAEKLRREQIESQYVLQESMLRELP